MIAQLLDHRRGESAHGQALRSLTERSQRRDVDGAELADLIATDRCDPREMVVAYPAIAADRHEIATWAVLARPRVCLGLQLDV